MTLFSHGTTVATNALITRRFPKVAMVTTRGFRDVLEIRRGTKDDLWDAYKDVAPAIIPRRDRLEVTRADRLPGRRSSTPLDEDEARAVAEDLRARNVETVAVCFINAYANPANELRMREILEAELPGRDDLDVERDPAGDLRVRALLDDGRQRRALTARRRLRQATRREAAGRRLRRRPAAAALRRRRDDRGARAEVRGAARRVGHRRGRDRLPRSSRRCAASRTPSAWTWAARAPTSRSSTAARCARPTSGRSSTATRSASRASRS